jgi:bifunctional non-homologous end joining protein LigD
VPARADVRATRIPFRVRPMLATLAAGAFHLPGWVYEEKYDGYRIVAYKEGRDVTLLSRNLKDRTQDFRDVADAIRSLAAPTLALDGEVVVFDAAGISRFQLMQRHDGADSVFMVFDCLYARGRDLRRLPLTERRSGLEAEVRDGRYVRLARRLADDGFVAFHEAERRGLEGVIAKDGRSSYEADTRSPAWRKVKVRQEEEFVIGGFTAPEGARQHFGAILVGASDAGRLRYAGKVGTGYTAKTLASLMARFRPLVRATSPFVDAPRERGVTWLEPELVAQIGFTELTGDGRLRHPTFLGLREDKNARDVRWPRPAAAPANATRAKRKNAHQR